MVEKKKTIFKLNLKDKSMEVLGKKLRMNHTDVRFLIDGDANLIESFKFNEIEIEAISDE